MDKQVVVSGIINTISGEHLVIHHIEDGAYLFPGGRIEDNDIPANGLVKTVFSQSGLRFEPKDFEIINIDKKIENNKEKITYTFGCKKLISDVAPIFTTEKKVKPLFMEPSVFYNLTSAKESYLSLFPQS